MQQDSVCRSYGSAGYNGNHGHHGQPGHSYGQSGSDGGDGSDGGLLIMQKSAVFHKGSMHEHSTSLVITCSVSFPDLLKSISTSCACGCTVLVQD